ncbi:hypothetical protein GYB61_11985 [bacterium]|nr:hypothetical protein [bacterium]
MPSNTLLHIPREGWLILLAIAGLIYAVDFAWGLVAAGPFLLLFLAAGLVFYDADHKLSSNPLGIVAPVDSVVLGLDEVDDPFLKRRATRLSFRPALFGGYCLRAATEGKLGEMRCDVSTRQASWIQTDEGDDVVTDVPVGSLFGLKPVAFGYGQRVGHGRRCGLRRLARQVDLYLPLGSRIDVKPGQRVNSGSDVVATLVRKKTPAPQEEQAT